MAHFFCLPGRLSVTEWEFRSPRSGFVRSDGRLIERPLQPRWRLSVAMPLPLFCLHGVQEYGCLTPLPDVPVFPIRNSERQVWRMSVSTSKPLQHILRSRTIKAVRPSRSFVVGADCVFSCLYVLGHTLGQPLLMAMFPVSLFFLPSSMFSLSNVSCT